MWYFLTTVVNKKDTLIELNGSYGKMAKYFFSDIEDKRYFEDDEDEWAFRKRCMQTGLQKVKAGKKKQIKR